MINANILPPIIITSPHVSGEASQKFQWYVGVSNEPGVNIRNAPQASVTITQSVEKISGTWPRLIHSISRLTLVIFARCLELPAYHVGATSLLGDTRSSAELLADSVHVP
jgi:hypothetical protein